MRSHNHFCYQWKTNCERTALGHLLILCVTALASICYHLHHLTQLQRIYTVVGITQTWITDFPCCIGIYYSISLLQQRLHLHASEKWFTSAITSSGVAVTNFPIKYLLFLFETLVSFSSLVSLLSPLKQINSYMEISALPR